MVKTNAAGSVVYMTQSEGGDVLSRLESGQLRPGFIHVSHDKSYDSGLNLIQIGRKDPRVKDLMVSLANHGYYMYMSQDGVSRLVRDDQLGKLWHPVRDGEYEINDDGVVYAYKKPAVETQVHKLLVVFSSIHETMYSSSLMRYFTQNFSWIQKYLAPETAVLRIADVGGIVGNFYLNTKYRVNNVDQIQSVITSVMSKYNISSENVVLYGVSKGATGALYHGLVGRYKAVVVEPIVNDSHYHTVYNDLHFTNDTFFELPKEEEFRIVVDEYKRTVDAEERAEIVVVYSSKSPQKPYIEETVTGPLRRHIRTYDSLHPGISGHADVGKNTIPLVLASINSLLYQVPLDTGTQIVV